MGEGVLDREDGEEVGEWGGGGGAEDACNAAEGVILGYTREVEEGLGGLLGPQRGSVGEHREDNGVVYLPPVREV